MAPLTRRRALSGIQSSAILRLHQDRMREGAEQEGRFARDWVLESKAGQAQFKALRRPPAEFSIEDVGAKLRAMMPRIGANKLVAGTNDWAKREDAGGGGCFPWHLPALQIAGTCPTGNSAIASHPRLSTVTAEAARRADAIAAVPRRSAPAGSSPRRSRQ